MVEGLKARFVSTPIEDLDKIEVATQKLLQIQPQIEEIAQKSAHGIRSTSSFPPNMSTTDKESMQGLKRSLMCREPRSTEQLIEVECQGVQETVSVTHNNPVYIPAEIRIKEVIQEVRPSVVGFQMFKHVVDVETGESKVMSHFGSGFVIDYEDLDLVGYEPKPTESLIATNYHVTDGVQMMQMSLFDDRVYAGPVRVLVADQNMDVAIVVVDTEGGLTLDPASIGSDDDVSQGDFVLAFGQPLGMPFRVTSGIVNNENYDREHIIQTDAAINHGNSGGPLVDLSSGRVVGMNTSIIENANNIGFAMPIWQQIQVLRKNWEEEHFSWTVSLECRVPKQESEH